MIRAYIFGTPHGFDAFGCDKSIEGYLKEFYVSSREGKRMMVNRRANGEVMYTFLHYGLMERGEATQSSVGRSNAFFGMSLHLTDNLYTPDFNEMYGWFEFLFGRILEQGTLLKKRDTGIIQYQVFKFSQAESTAWLQSNLPNIFSAESHIKRSSIDKTFSSGNVGRVAQLNPSVGDDVLLDTFKQYAWIAISPLFGGPDGGDNSSIELDYNDLNNKLASCNEQFVAWMVNLDEKAKLALHNLKSSIVESHNDIANYIKKLTAEKSNSNNSEKKTAIGLYIDRFEDLRGRYRKTYDSINAILNQAPSESKTKKCTHCGKELELTAFSSDSATMCKQCEKEYKRCHRCGRTLHRSLFAEGGNICNDCDTHPTHKKCVKCGHLLPITEFRSGSNVCLRCSKKPMPWAKIAASVVAVVAVAVVLIVVFGGSGEGSGGKIVPPAKDYVDTSILNGYYVEYNYTDAYEYIKGKEDAKDHLNAMGSRIEEQLWKSINTLDKKGKPQKSDVPTVILNKLNAANKATNEEISNYVNVTGITAIVNDYSGKKNCLCFYLFKVKDERFGDDSKKAVDIILNKDENKYNEAWREFAEERYAKYQEIKGGAAPPPQPEYVTIKIFDTDGKTLIGDPKEYEIGSTETPKISVERGQFIEFHCPDKYFISYTMPKEKVEGTRDHSTQKAERMLRLQPTKNIGIEEDFSVSLKENNNLRLTINVVVRVGVA